jgi:serine/threonine protein kinase
MSRGFRYRVLRKIAHGGMAEIFTALQVGAEGFEKPVVLKRILPALAADPAFVRMLVDEAHIASSLLHSNLVQVLDLGKVEDQFFLALEFVDGWSLEQIRKRARKTRLKLPLPLALHIVSSLCRGLDYVHRRTRHGKPLGIVHRDVTPQNVLISREGEVKLADFGIAKASGRREKSATGVIKGKFAYMSPEQSIGAELDARSDLFSVGTLLYLLTTGRKPFEASSDLDVLMMVRRARFEKPSTFVKDYNPEVERFLVRALRADKARRWQSAEQMADKLDAILVKLGQPSGSAALKRWLETLGTRDGMVAPGDLRDTPDDSANGTMQLVSSELELQDVGRPEEPSDDDDDEPATAPLLTRARTNLVAHGAAEERSVAAAGEHTAAVREADLETIQVSVDARGSAHEQSKVAGAKQVAHASAQRSEEVTMAASPDYGVAMTWTGVPLTLATPSRKLPRQAQDDDTIDESLEHGHAAARERAGADEDDERESERPPEPSSFRSRADLRASSTIPILETQSDPIRSSGPSRLGRTLKRAAFGGVVLPALVMGSLYAARPLLPPWLAPELMQVVDGWLKEIPNRLDALRSRALPADDGASSPDG